MSELSINNLSVRVSNRFELSNICCDFRPGELTGVVGPNGSGKSTLAKCLVGLQAIDSGTIQIDGTPLLELDQSLRAQKLGYLPQQAAIAWRILTRDAVSLGRLHRSPRQDLDEYLRVVMDECGIAHLAERNVAELSGGEQMRVHLARVFFGEHQFIVADEPCASLDIEHQHRIMGVLKNHSAQNTTIVIIHDLSLAQKYCDRLLLIDAGRIVLDNKPQIVLRSEQCAKIFNTQFSEYIAEEHGNQSDVLLLPRTE